VNEGASTPIGNSERRFEIRVVWKEVMPFDRLALD
jgi:hypothetical protein